MYDYRADSHVDLAGLRSLLERAGLFPGFHGLDSEDRHGGYFERERLDGFEIAWEGVQVRYVDVRGRLGGEALFEDFAKVFSRGLAVVGDRGTLRVWVDFGERGSPPLVESSLPPLVFEEQEGESFRLGRAVSCGRPGEASSARTPPRSRSPCRIAPPSRCWKFSGSSWRDSPPRRGSGTAGPHRPSLAANLQAG